MIFSWFESRVWRPWDCMVTYPYHMVLNGVSWVDINADQYPKRRLSVRSRYVSKPRDLYLELSDRCEIWQALRQQCCRCVCQISQRYDNLKYQSRGFETLRDLTERRLFGYWDGAQNFLDITCITPLCFIIRHNFDENGVVAALLQILLISCTLRLSGLCKESIFASINISLVEFWPAENNVY